MKIFNYAYVLFISCCAFNAFALPTVSNIDLNKYLGKWYEIARFDSWFEKDCVYVTAEYSLGGNIINVLNSCNLKAPNGKFKQAHGRATIVANSNNAKLKISFLPKSLRAFDSLFAGDYWILKIDRDYEVVLSGAPSKKYLWILARSIRIEPEIYSEYVDYAKTLGFNVENLHKTLQPLD